MDLDEALQHLRRGLALRSSLWEVDATETTTGRWLVECRHPASHGMGAAVDPDKPEQVGHLASGWSQHREFMVASVAPALAHPDRVLSLRTLIDAFQWTQKEVQGLTFALWAHGFLTLDETAWLAGFTATDAPMRLVSPVAD